MDELNKLSQTYKNIIQLNNNLLESLISKTPCPMMFAPPPVEDYDQQDDDDEYSF